MLMRRIFLVLAMLALLVITAMPATAQSDWWDDNDNSRGDRGSDRGGDWWEDDDDKDWWEDDNDHQWEDDNDHQWEDDYNIWCGWFPSWHGGPDLWCYYPGFGWWEAS
jgi:hypothetical protein